MIFIIELPNELAEEFSPSLTNPSGKALKDVDMYDFLDYMIGRGQQNQATSELKDALIGLKKLESSQPNNTPPNTPSPNNTPPSTQASTPNKPSPNNTPPTKPSPEQNATKPNTQASTTKTNAENPTATKANDSTQPKQSDQTNADNATQNISKSADNAINPPPYAEGELGGGYDLARYKELESSLDYRFEKKFKRQAEQELGKSLDIEKLDKDLQARKITYTDHSRITKEINNDYAKWLDTQKAAGNKEILEYFNDLAEYRKLDNAIRIEKQEKADKAYYKKAAQEWLEKQKHNYANKTDNEIITTQLKQAGKSYDEAKHLLATMRKDIERNLDLHPIAEFGTNYAEFYQDGKGAISKLIAEANAAKELGQDFSGQVAGAFSKEIDGAPARIDLVWGNEKMGLEKILQKHLDDFSDFSGGNPHKKLANGLSEIITRGEASKTHNGYNISFNDFIVRINKGWNENGVKKGDNKWIVTAFDNSKEISKKATAANFTEGAAQPNNPADEIITKIQEKMKVSKEYAKNLAKWHKDSHPITKEADGTPKVFYHSSRDIFETFDKNFDESKWGFWFSPLKEYIDDFRARKRVKGADKVYKVFLKAKKIADLTDDNFFDETIKQALKTTTKDKISFYPYMTHSNEFKYFLKNQGYDGLIWNAQGKRPALVVFDSNQIKEVGNKGTFDATNPNIYHSSSTAGGGVLGGAIAGVEKDDEGNIIGFSPEKFALGFAAGASGAKMLSGIFKHKQAQNYAQKSIKNLQKEYQALQEHNLPLFAKIMSDIPPQVFIKPSKEAKKLSNDIFNKELAQVIQNAINKDSIKELPQANFKNINDFRGNFDKVKNNIGYLDTPLGQIRVNTQYALHHFTNNTYYKDRTNIKGGFFETFRNPLFVIEDDTKGKGSIYFYKPFYDKEKNMLNLFGIGVNQKGIINFKTYYLDEKKSRLKQLLKNEGVKIRYVAKE